MRRRVALGLTLVALLAAAGCGGDDETAETVPSTPELTVPGEGTPDIEDRTTETSTDSTDTAPSDGGGSGGDGGGTPAPGGGDGSGGGSTPPSGGQQAPNDTPQNDTPPPAGSPAERFEQFCEQNPGAC